MNSNKAFSTDCFPISIAQFVSGGSVNCYNTITILVTRAPHHQAINSNVLITYQSITC